MAIQIADGFQLKVAKPLDDRQNVETVAQLDPTYGYEGQIVYVKDIKQFYTCYKDENGSLAYKVMETGSSTPNESAGIKLWVSGESYEENDFVSYNDYIYRCLTSNSDVDFDETHWDKLSDDFNELTVADIEAMLGLSSEQLETMTNLIADKEVRLDKTYSSSKIYQDIQQCLNDSKTFTLLELGKFSGAGYKIVTSTSEMTSETIIYLLANGNTYDMYIVEENGATTKIGDMDVNLDNYFTKTEVDNDFLKKVDADSKYATITTVDGKVDKTDIVDNLTSTDTDKPLSANQGKILKDTKLNKTDANKLNCVTIDNVSLKEYILTNCTETDKTYYLIAKTTCTDLPKVSNFYITVETPGFYTYKVTAKELNDSNGIYVCTYRAISSSWTKWEKVCTTSVADVPWTQSTMGSGMSGAIYYRVKNGICYVYVQELRSPTMSTTHQTVATNLPVPERTSSVWYSITTNSPTGGTLIVNINGIGEMINHIGVDNASYYGTFSYPVMEW